MSNVLSFTGALGRDAELRYTASGTALLSFPVANNVGFGERQQTLWIQITLFGQRAVGPLRDYLKKGQQVFVSGELTINEYISKDGTTKTALNLNASIIDLVGRRKEESEPNGNYATATQTQPPQGADSENDADYNDDIPF